MADLKTLYDHVTQAQARVQEVVNRIDVLMAQGDEEGKTQALAMEGELDSAVAQRDQAVKFYDKIVNAQKDDELLKKFVPVSETPAAPEAEKPQDVMTLAQFKDLAPSERLAYAKRGGKIQE